MGLNNIMLRLALACSAVAVLSAQPGSSAIRRASDLSRRGEYRQALGEYSALLSGSALSGNAEAHAYILSQMADAEMELGEAVAAETRARQALRILADAHLDGIGTFAVVEGVLAAALRAEGSYKEARYEVERALALGKRTLDPLSPSAGVLMTTLAQILEETGDLRRARSLCVQAVEVFSKAGPANRIHLGSAYQNLAVVYASLGKPKRALRSVNLALATWNEVLPANHAFVVYALATKVVAYTKLKAFRQAEAIVPEMLSLGESRFGVNHPQRLIVLNNAAAVYVAEKKYPQAAALLQEAAEAGRHHFPVGHPLFRGTLLNYCYVLEKLHRREEAARERAEAEVILAFPARSRVEQIR